MFFYLLYKVGIFLALACPLRLVYAIATAAAYVKYAVSRTERLEIYENLRQVLPLESTKTLKLYARRIFVNFSKYLVDFFRFDKIDAEYIKDRVEVVNRDCIDGALKRGKGAIVLSAHLGNWELGGVIVGLLGHPLNVIALDHANKRINEFFIRQRSSKGEKVIPVNVALRRCFSALANNEILGILGDKDYANHGVFVKFFGRDTVLPKGPAVFSLKTGASIVPGFMIRTPEDNFQFIFDKPIEYRATGNFEEDVIALTERCGLIIEGYIRRYPTQWYCFRRFWQG